MSIVYDLWNNPLEISKAYVAHRNRLIDVHLIHTFQAKGKRLLINTFKQNAAMPTMCIFFDSKEKALQAYDLMKQVYYGPAPLVTQDSDIRVDMAYALMVAAMVLPVMLAILAAYK